MSPVRIKYCGLFWMTRRGYLLFVALATALLLGACVVARVRMGLDPFTRPPWEPSLRRYRFLAWTWNWWTLGPILLLVPVEVLLTLRRFARREAEQSATATSVPAEESPQGR